MRPSNSPPRQSWASRRSPGRCAEHPQSLTRPSEVSDKRPSCARSAVDRAARCAPGRVRAEKGSSRLQAPPLPNKLQPFLSALGQTLHPLRLRSQVTMPKVVTVPRAGGIVTVSGIEDVQRWIDSIRLILVHYCRFHGRERVGSVAVMRVQQHQAISGRQSV